MSVRRVDRRSLGKLLRVRAQHSYRIACSNGAPSLRGEAMAPGKESDRITHSVITERAVKGAAGVTARTTMRHHQRRPTGGAAILQVAKRIPDVHPDFPSQPCSGSRSMTEQGLLGPGLRTFFRIAEKWQISHAQQCLLLGCQDQQALDSLLDGDFAEMPRDVLVRISYFLGIYKALHTIFPNEHQADSWMIRPNSAPLFAGRSAINFVAEEGVDGLAALRKYLDEQLG